MSLPPLSAASPLSTNTLTGFLFGIVTVVGFHACLYLGAYWFFAKHLYRDYEIKRLSVQNLFSATFTVCVSMLQLLLLELLHVLNPTLRKWVWNIDLICVLLLLYLILPVSIVYNLLVPDQDLFKIPDLVSALPRLQNISISCFSLGCLNLPTSLPLPASLNIPSSLAENSWGLASLLPTYPIPWRRWFLVALGCCVFLPLLWSCFYQSGRFLHLDPAILASLSYTECLLAYVGVCGVTVVSALAGFGSVNYPYKNITAFLSPVSQEQVAEVEQRLLQTLSLIAEKKKKRKQLQQSLGKPGRSSHWPTPTTGLHSTRLPSTGGSHSASLARESRGASQSSTGLAESDIVVVHDLAVCCCEGESLEGRYSVDVDTDLEREIRVTGAGECRRNTGEDFFRDSTSVGNRSGGQDTRKSRERAAQEFRGRQTHTAYCGDSGQMSEIAIGDVTKQGYFEPRELTRSGAHGRASVPRGDKCEGHAGKGHSRCQCPRRAWTRARRMWAKATAAVMGRSAERECQQLQSEIAALEDLSRELFVGLDDLVQSRAQAIYSKTVLGRLNNLMGWCMTVVCVYRVTTAAVNVLLDRVSTTDPATRTLEVALYYLNIPLNIAVVSPYLSLLLLGWIIALTIRGFIEKLLAVFRYVSTSVSSNVFALVMSEIMGFYFSACVLLTRVYLPQSYRDAVTEMIAPSLDFRVFHLHFDRVFLLSSLASLGIVMLSHRHSLEKLKNL
ncbi:g protein-coupled receptor 89 isoform 5 [Cystoisospora suis]|uniref:G protein-coupled receptor 89 isoform 5 n=1 Tax=Cystoisospora suis TaxID=483139 RepID=A0A2C6L0Q5_9APIC|nr:g protein-coupled receptor 89 isoform 5 [Cystoisospora suis]